MAAGNASWVPLQPSEARQARCHLHPFPALPFEKAGRRANRAKREERHRSKRRTVHQQMHAAKRSCQASGAGPMLLHCYGNDHTNRHNVQVVCVCKCTILIHIYIVCMLAFVLSAKTERAETHESTCDSQSFCTATGMTTRTITACKCVQCFCTATGMTTRMLCVCLRLFCLQNGESRNT